MSKHVAVIAPSYDGSRIADVLAAAGYGIAVYGIDCDELPDADAIVVHAFASDAANLLASARDADRRCVLSSAPGADVTSYRPGFTEPDCIERVASFRADAYFWRWLRLSGAIHFALTEDRTERQRGPLRLTFLGHAGSDNTRATAPDVGQSFEIGSEPTLIGRPSKSRPLIGFTTAVARRHASIVATAGGAVVRDEGSTNGLWLAGQRIEDEASLKPGDELTVAGFLRLRLDGAPS